MNLQINIRLWWSIKVRKNGLLLYTQSLFISIAISFFYHEQLQRRGKQKFWEIFKPHFINGRYACFSIFRWCQMISTLENLLEQDGLEVECSGWYSNHSTSWGWIDKSSSLNWLRSTIQSSSQEFPRPIWEPQSMQRIFPRHFAQSWQDT